ncbi:UNVERIFIED_CONTAM: hypothetical protein Slati_4456100 [Sesamum latifolium]|uniref:Uncharacterized protein n=1 Tax=Sesamum latifolium TaxID=2727402 RepID=A0AAW2SR14_9LAMI
MLGIFGDARNESTEAGVRGRGKEEDVVRGGEGKAMAIWRRSSAIAVSVEAMQAFIAE